MKVVVFVKATKATEAGVMPTTAELSAMGEYNERLVKAGIMKAGDGLHPSAKAARVVFAASGPQVHDGPFAETKELVAGYWIWEVKSMDEAIAWAKECPIQAADTDQAVLEIRPIFSAEDFGPEYTPELRERDQKLEEQLEGKA